MSTRATYSFISSAPEPAQTTLFLRMDGYPEGVACYFRAMLAVGEPVGEGVGAVAFIRANVDSRLISGPGINANTRFRYSLTRNHLLAEERVVLFEQGWKTIFDGPLVDFIKAHPLR